MDRNLLHISEAASLGLHAMAALAHHGDRRLTTPALATVMNASPHTLAKVMQQLVRAGLVDSVRGPSGGFALARPAKDINLLTIYEAVEGPIGKAACLLGNPICGGETCVLGGLIQSVQHEVRDYLSKTRLSELAKGLRLR